MEEVQLLQKAVKGDDSAFEELANAYQPRIYAVCLRVLKSEQDAQDACQETLIKIYTNIKKFRFSSRFSTWIYTIARNTALDLLRRKRPNISSIEDYKEAGMDIPDMQSGPDAKTEQNEIRHFITGMINSLNIEQRICIVLKDVDGYSIDEISDILNLPEGTVKSRLHRGREKLRVLIADAGIEI